MASGKRDHLIDIALELFCRDGFHATGIDKILATAGVARMTLYNHFKSKDELILATLRRRDEKFRNWFMRTVERLASSPQKRLLAMFDALEEWFLEKDFTGCMFINASAEYAETDDPIHMVAAEHKILMAKYVHELSAAAGVDEPKALADELVLLMEGSIIMAHVVGDRKAATPAKNAARKLIEQSLR